MFFFRGKIATCTLVNTSIYPYMSHCIVCFYCKSNHYIDLALISENSFHQQTLVRCSTRSYVGCEGDSCKETMPRNFR